MLTIHDTINHYFSLQNAIFAHVGYVENWRIFPLVDHRNYLWYIDGSEDDGHVCFAETKPQLEDKQLGNFYQYEIYTQRHLPKWVYRGDIFTVIVVDTHVDGNKILMLLDNAKEVNLMP